MAANTTKIFGYVMTTLCLAFYAYYTLWVIATPFFPSDHFVQSFFPPRYWAIAGPMILCVLGFACYVPFIAIVMIQTRPKSPPKERYRVFPATESEGSHLKHD